MLQRIYGTAWESSEQLKEHERHLNEAKKRDHRLLGKKLDLFSIQVQFFFRVYHQCSWAFALQLLFSFDFDIPS